MGRTVSTSVQKQAAEDMCGHISTIDGVSAEISGRNSGTSSRNVVSVDCLPESWRELAVSLRDDHGVDYCSMITGIHWPEGGPDKNWEVIYHFLRMGVIDPPVVDGMIEPIITDPTPPTPPHRYRPSRHQTRQLRVRIRGRGRRVEAD